MASGEGSNEVMLKVWVSVAQYRDLVEMECEVLFLLGKTQHTWCSICLLIWTFRAVLLVFKMILLIFYKQLQWQLLCPTGYFCLSFTAA